MTNLTRDRIAWWFTALSLAPLSVAAVCGRSDTRLLLGCGAAGMILAALLYWPPKRG